MIRDVERITCDVAGCDNRVDMMNPKMHPSRVPAGWAVIKISNGKTSLDGDEGYHLCPRHVAGIDVIPF